MGSKIKVIILLLFKEVRKDICFFGTFGFFVGILIISEEKLKHFGVAEGESWPGAVLSEMISMNVFVLFFLGLLGLGSLATILRVNGRKLPRLKKTVSHLESRFAQFTSVMISVTVGFLLWVFLYSLTVNGRAEALRLASIILKLDFVLFIGFIFSACVARRVKPFDSSTYSIGALIASIVTSIFLLFFGNKW